MQEMAVFGSNFGANQQPENSWHTTTEFCPDYEVPRSKRIELSFINLLPIESVLCNSRRYLKPGNSPLIPAPGTTSANDATSRRGSGPPP